MSKKDPLHERLRMAAEPPEFEAFEVPEQARIAFYRAMGEWTYGGCHGFWMDPESKDGHCDPEAFVFTVATRMNQLSCAFNGASIKSPIEAQLFGAMLWMELDWAGFPDFDAADFFDERPSAMLPDADRLQAFITPQAAIGAFKADFVLWFQYRQHRAGVVIECDGHEFHERTKEQASRDKRRDREIVCAGYPVLRFTGSEIFKDPVACANQIRDASFEALNRVSKAGGLIS